PFPRPQPSCYKRGRFDTARCRRLCPLPGATRAAAARSPPLTQRTQSDNVAGVFQIASDRDVRRRTIAAEAAGLDCGMGFRRAALALMIALSSGGCSSAGGNGGAPRTGDMGPIDLASPVATADLTVDGPDPDLSIAESADLSSVNGCSNQLQD